MPLKGGAIAYRSGGHALGGVVFSTCGDILRRLEQFVKDNVAFEKERVGFVPAPVSS
jgi:hypothetical protein